LSGLRLYTKPRSLRSRQAKLHQKGCSAVQIKKPSNTGHKESIDSHYIAAQIKLVKEYVVTQDALVFSMDRKAQIPLRGAAVSKSTKNVQAGNHFIQKPDHDFSVHKGNSIESNVIVSLNIGNDLKWSFSNAAIMNRSTFIQYDCSDYFLDIIRYMKIYNLL